MTTVFRSIGGVLSSSPEIVAWGQNDFNLFAFAVGTDQALWYAQLNGFGDIGGSANLWSAWQSLGGVVMSRPSAVRSAATSVDVFAVGQHCELLNWQFRNGVWTSWPEQVVAEGAASMDLAISPPTPHRYWQSLGGVLTSPPHAILFGALDNTILVFARGTDSALWSLEGVDGLWGQWTSLGHHVESPPHAVTWREETFAVFALGTDSAIWQMMGSAWQSLGGGFSSAPYAVASANFIHVFAADAQSALKHIRWDGSSWGQWESLDGILMSAPTANSFETNERLHVYGLGTDFAIWHRVFDGSSWGGWSSFGGPFLSPPSTVTRLPSGAPTRELLTLGTDHSAWHFELFDP
jgi:hypothetical protein